jgi:hypothetical protein
MINLVLGEIDIVRLEVALKAMSANERRGGCEKEAEAYDQLAEKLKRLENNSIKEHGDD